MLENYLGILEDSLKQKLIILDAIAKYSEEQEELLKKDTLSLEEFDVLVDKKDELVQKLNKLDEGFEILYDRVREQLSANRAAYKVQIENMKNLITAITDKSVSIQAREARNKEMVEKHFKGMRHDMRNSRKSSQAALGYYKSMSNTNVAEPRFMDQKK